ncbi:helix-turn-helix domain-containing protein (plasmid) [Bradyrhizobium sp. vgs-9]|uniref:helix-turn-helix domain-containing protein n=1 Tax=Bradyrhizobium sp. vgs-9 TaxID=208389 RepID=UPI0035D42964
MDRSYLASLERQAKKPTINLLDRIAETLGVHVSEFFVQAQCAEKPETLPEGRKPVPRRRRKRI